MGLNRQLLVIGYRPAALKLPRCAACMGTTLGRICKQIDATFALRRFVSDREDCHGGTTKNS
jgi:hypothetical protein